MQGVAEADGRSGGSPNREKSHDSVAFLFFVLFIIQYSSFIIHFFATFLNE